MKWKVLLPDNREIEVNGATFSAAAEHAMRCYPITDIYEPAVTVIVTQPKTKTRRAERRRFIMRVQSYWGQDYRATPIEGEVLPAL